MYLIFHNTRIHSDSSQRVGQLAHSGHLADEVHDIAHLRLITEHAMSRRRDCALMC